MKDTVSKDGKPRVLLELRAALDGFAGIPQETRLLFRGLRMIKSLEVEGMIQASLRILAKGTRETGGFFRRRQLTQDRKINRYSRVVISVAERPFYTIIDKLLDNLERRLMSVRLTVQTLIGSKQVR